MDYFFTLTMLCISTVFAVVRCLSVHPSVTLVDCIHMAEDIVKLLVRPGSAIILVFLTQSADTQFQGNPFIGDAKYTGWQGKLVIFD